MNVAAPPSERIRAYLDGTLDEREREDFELALFDDPDLAEAVDAERLLRIGMREIESRRSTRDNVVPLPPPRPLVLQLLPLAASLAVGVLVGALAIPARGPAPAAAGHETAPANRKDGIGGKAQFEGLSVSRGAQADEPLLRVPADTPQLVLQFTRPRPAHVRDYVFELDLPDGTTQSFPHLLPGRDTNVSVSLAAAALPDGRYNARLVAIGNDGTRSEDQSRSFVLQHATP